MTEHRLAFKVEFDRILKLAQDLYNEGGTPVVKAKNRNNAIRLLTEGYGMLPHVAKRLITDPEEYPRRLEQFEREARELERKARQKRLADEALF